MLYTEDLEQFSAKHRIWQGIPSIEVTKGGRIFSTFYSGGVAESLGNFCVVIKSDDGGVTFSEPIAVAYLGEYARCYDPNLWIDPLGRLWFLWAEFPNSGVAFSICEDPDAQTLVWSEPRRIGPEVMMDKPVVLSSGEWIFPISVWGRKIRRFLDMGEWENCRPYAYKTTDQGKTFVKLGGPLVKDNIRSFDEHMIFERRDGSLAMYIRVTYGIAISYSYDGGRTWTDPAPSGINGPSTRFFVSRLSSGKLLLIYHDCGERGSRRERLTAFLSDDDGRTWASKLLLDARGGSAKDGGIAYPDAKEDENGNIWITYDHDRGAFKDKYEDVVNAQREILLARVTERDIEAGELVSEASFLARVISKLDGGNEEARATFERSRIKSTAELVDKLSRLATADDISADLYARFGMVCTAPDRMSKYKIDSVIEEIAKDFDDKIKLRVLLTRVIGVLSTEEPVSAELPEGIMLRAIEYVRAHRSEDFKLSEMAAELNISRFYLCHLFKTKTGISIIAYKNALRMQDAKRLLVTTDRMVSEIAEETGFADISYFSEMFRESEGLTPQDYRKNNKN